MRGKPRWLVGVCRAVLSSLLAVTAVAKLSSGHDPGYWLRIEWYYVAAIAELVASVAVWTRVSQAVARLLVVVLVAVTVKYWISGDHWQCGCFGGWPVTRRQHLALISIMGLCALILARAAVSGKSSLDEVNRRHTHLLVFWVG